LEPISEDGLVMSGVLQQSYALPDATPEYHEYYIGRRFRDLGTPDFVVTLSQEDLTGLYT
jgi:hypothetical protein